MVAIQYNSAGLINTHMAVTVRMKNGLSDFPITLRVPYLTTLF
jgi:hypothetical protein